MPVAIPAEAVLGFLDSLQEDGVCMHGFTLSHAGKVLHEGYFKPFAKEKPHRVYSVAKSVTSLCIGLLINSGLVGLNHPIAAYFPEYVNDKTDERLLRTTIRDMLRMATCYHSTTYARTDDPNWARSFFTLTPDYEPGGVFAYDTSASQVLGALVEKISGMSLLDFAQQNIFTPIGALDEKRWLKDPVGVCQGGSGLLMTLSDFTKLAQLCLDGGRNVLPQDYVAAATSLQIKTPLQVPAQERYGYGYQIWRCRDDSFWLYGMGGQLAICHPKTSLMMCCTADTRLDPEGVSAIHNAFFGKIVPCLHTAQSEESSQALKSRLAKLACATVPNSEQYAVKTGVYAFAKNELHIERLELTDDHLCLLKDGKEMHFAYDVGEMAYATFPGTDEPTMTSAGFIAPGVWRLRCHVIGDDPCGVDVLLHFVRDSVHVKMRRSHEVYTMTFEGVACGYAAN